jgi:hypothetical protein
MMWDRSGIMAPLPQSLPALLENGAAQFVVATERAQDGLRKLPG